MADLQRGNDMDVLKIAICDDTVEECREVEACAARFSGIGG